MRSLIELKNGHIASGHGDGQIRIWDQRTKKCMEEWKGHTDRVNTLIKINNDNIVSCSSDRTIRIWDIKTNKSIGIINGHE